jgi:ABC-type Na+ efflux pump permease subunit
MVAAVVVVSALAVVLWLSTMLCGLWIRSKGLKDQQSLSFHVRLGVVAGIAGIVSCALSLISSLTR